MTVRRHMFEPGARDPRTCRCGYRRSNRGVHLLDSERDPGRDLTAKLLRLFPPTKTAKGSR